MNSAELRMYIIVEKAVAKYEFPEFLSFILMILY